MTASPDAPQRARSTQDTAQRVEDLLDRLAASADPAAAATAEDLVRALMDFYGTGLARVVALLSGRSGNPLGALLDDEVAAGLLALHDLHPDDTRARVERALRSADAGGALSVAGYDEETGALRLRRQEDAGCGCPSTGAALLGRVEAAVSCFAPEVASVDLDEPAPARREPVLLQIGARQPGSRTVAADPAGVR